jgi:release factor glutamine methyltransferase
MKSRASHPQQDAAVALSKASTVGNALALARLWLRSQPGNESAALDAQLLLAHVTGQSRAGMLAYPERALTADEAEHYSALVARRAAREPVAYLTGHRAFMGLDFLTDARALIPRPETELLVSAALAELAARLATGGALPVIADIGTGSGAIAVALAAQAPQLETIYATDISSDALTLAQENAQRLGVAAYIQFLPGDLLEPLPELVDLLLANLPYVAPREATALPDDVRRYEPALALYGDDDGLGHLRRLFAQAPGYLKPGAAILLEFGYDQRRAVETLARETFPGAETRIIADYAGWDRIAVIQTHEDLS